MKNNNLLQTLRQSNLFGTLAADEGYADILAELFVSLVNAASYFSLLFYFLFSSLLIFCEPQAKDL